MDLYFCPNILRFTPYITPFHCYIFNKFIFEQLLLLLLPMLLLLLQNDFLEVIQKIYL